MTTPRPAYFCFPHQTSTGAISEHHQAAYSAQPLHRAAENDMINFVCTINSTYNKHKICAKVRKIIQSQDFLSQFWKYEKYIKVSISFMTSPDDSWQILIIPNQS